MVDADAIVRRMLDRPVVRRSLVKAFGPGVMRGGRIDRAAVARAAFADAASVRRLNAAVHPHVRREIVRRLRRRRGATVLDAPLLLETGADKLCDVVVFVDAPIAKRIRRAAKRGWDGREVRRREKFQWPVSRKRARADFVVRNNGSRAELRKRVGILWERIRGSV